MGNSEGSHSRSLSHSGSVSDSPRHRSKPQKVKSSEVVSPVQKKSPGPSGMTVFYDTLDSGDDRFRTCKPDLVASTHSKEPPAYYFTASQLSKAKNKSKSQDADLNRISSYGQKPDVRRIAWSSSNRESDTDAVSMIHCVISDNSMFEAVGMCLRLTEYMLTN